MKLEGKLEGEYFKKNDILLVSDDGFFHELHIYKDKEKEEYIISIKYAGDLGIEYSDVTFSKEKMFKLIKLLNEKIR